MDVGRLTGQYVQDVTKNLQEAIPEIVQQEQQAAASMPDNEHLNEAVRAGLERGAQVQDKIMGLMMQRLDQQAPSAGKRPQRK